MEFGETASDPLTTDTFFIVDERVSFPRLEEDTLAYWAQIDAFQTSLKMSEGKPEFSFYDGPPFATGLPHYGHLLAGTIKDTVTRYAHQKGFHVTRRFGWDCHGLPIEFEIEKKLGIKTRDEILKMGIPEYNKACRGIVMQFSSEWERTVTRLGRWIDFQNDYKTLNLSFMESVWNVFSEVHKKGFLYRGFKVMPYSTGCSTPLSNFEANLAYRDTTDPAVVVSFPLEDEPGVSFVAWTTTPWTLPSNLALCVNPTLDYVKAKDKKTGEVYIICEKRTSEIWKTADLFTVEAKFKGTDLAGKKYKPLFPYFQSESARAFRVCVDKYVTDSSGTGIVHQAPAFGEDDYRVCLNHGVIVKGENIPCPVDEMGRFTDVVTDFAGKYVKAADDEICAKLKAEKRLVKKSNLVHSYPFCWRSDTPLIYKAVPSWFIAVEKVREELVANNKQTRWVPQNVSDLRFHNWLAEAKDWAVSRSRFWGTPIPIWLSEDKEEMIVIGSVKELEELSGGLALTGGGTLKRVEEVFDCWFESGSMPYAQIHYPFENQELFEKSFPADFIAEGIDQTRGWFYTLLVLSTILHKRPPFKNVVVNGLVLAEDGKKMSKRLKNYPDPNDVIKKYGADALRLYLINSPVVRAENLRFKESGVEGILKDVFLPWFHSFRFFAEAVRKYKKFTPNAKLAMSSQNVMDKWILAAVNELIVFVRKEMDLYHLDAVLPKLVRFIEQLTNWYLKFNRDRLKGLVSEDDTNISLSTLFEVLLTLTKLMAPVTPFLTEFFYQRLRVLLPEGERKDSVHYLDYPTVTEEALNPRIMEQVANMQSVILLGRTARERRTKPQSFPLTRVTSINSNPQFQADIESLKEYILEQLNVKELVLSSDSELVVNIARPDNKKLGARLGKSFKKVSDAIKTLTDEQIRSFQSEGSIVVEGQTISGDELFVIKEFKGDTTLQEPAWDSNALIVLDLTEDVKLQEERMVRRVINFIQRLRKRSGVLPEDHIEVFYRVEEGDPLCRVMEEERGGIVKRTGVPCSPLRLKNSTATVIASEDNEVDASKIYLEITVATLGFDDEELAKLGLEAEFLGHVKNYFTTREYGRVVDELNREGKLHVKMNGVDVTLTKDKHVFPNSQGKK
ncbi:isoleucine--tRNA ligase, cytoplasmic [Planoprotostelium fungivorum]|uniref:isoleucine--tRNA ligase n=1 Tax=Planoprotostelium fungivorum TaxID=1890364 RepID=A0A2P6MZM9_9EUKA|nr:isoleucine--tRNA ligase, cytoplasmic [Planoprotostelium fungivorum]